jgi:hypothetical protein
MNTQNEIITENLMTEEEMNQFFFDLMMTVQYDLFAMDGLTFFLNTISKLAATDSLKVQDTCDALSSLVFQNSIAFDKAQKSFGKNIHNRYRNTDCRKPDAELFNELEFTTTTSTNVEPALAETPNEQPEINQRYARYLSEILNDPNTPEQLIEGIQDGLTEVYNNALDQSAVNDNLKSVEYIEKLLSMVRGAK